MDDSGGAFVTDHGPDVLYRIGHQDNSRWDGFVFRPGDIVFSTRSRSGTTWMQMICALLIFQTPDRPAPLAEMSPWMEWLPLDREELLAGLAAQKHRRFKRLTRRLRACRWIRGSPTSLWPGIRWIWRCRCTTTTPISMRGA